MRARATRVLFAAIPKSSPASTSAPTGIVPWRSVESRSKRKLRAFGLTPKTLQNPTHPVNACNIPETRAEPSLRPAAQPKGVGVLLARAERRLRSELQSLPRRDVDLDPGGTLLAGAGRETERRKRREEVVP